MKKVESAHVFLVNTGNIRAELGLWRELWSKEGRFAVAIEDARGTPVSDNRNRAVKRFLQSGYGWMLMVDDDTIPTRNPLDLIYQNLDIVCFPTPMWNPGVIKHQPVYMNIEPLDKSGSDGESIVMMNPDPLMEIVTGGSGCILIARRVLEHPDLRAPFMDAYDEDGIRVQSEDITFIHRVRAAGFRAWAAMEYPCSHVKTVDLLRVHDEFRRAVAAARNA